MLEILKTYTTIELKKLIARYNKTLETIRGYSKLKKDELLTLMTKAENINKFKSVKAKVKSTPTPATPATPAPKTTPAPAPKTKPTPPKPAKPVPRPLKKEKAKEKQTKTTEKPKFYDNIADIEDALDLYIITNPISSKLPFSPFDLKSFYKKLNKFDKKIPTDSNTWDSIFNLRNRNLYDFLKRKFIKTTIKKGNVVKF